MKQKLSFHYRKLIYFFTLIFIFTLIGCNPSDQPSNADHPLKFARVKYSAEQIKNFLSDSKQSAFILQFSTPHPETASTPIGLVSYTISRKGDSMVVSPSYQMLANEADSVKEFKSSELVLGNNFIPKQRIIDALKGVDNKMLDTAYLDHILLLPFKDESNHLAYRLIATDKSGTFLPKAPPSTDPCPPRPCFATPSTINTSSSQ